MAGSILPTVAGGSLGSTASPWTDAVLSGSVTDADGNAKTPKEIHDHIDSTANPHSVTYTQVGADAAGSASAVAGNLAAALASRPLARYMLPAQSLDSALGTGWAVNANAPVDGSTDSAVRVFGDAAEAGVGTPALLIPTGSTSLKITTHWRAQTSPGASAGVVLKLYSRSQNNAAATSAWTAGTALATVTTSDATWNLDTETITLSTLGITAGDVRQFQITRTPTATEDTVTGNVLLESVTLEVA